MQLGHCQNQMNSKHISQVRSPGASSWVSGQWHLLFEGDYNGVPTSFHERNATYLRDPETQSSNWGPPRPGKTTRTQEQFPTAPVGFLIFHFTKSWHCLLPWCEKVTEWKISFFFFFLRCKELHLTRRNFRQWEGAHKTEIRSSHCGSAETNLTTLHEDTGLAQWVKDLVLPWAVV